MIRQIFVNLPVKNLEKTMNFYKKLGFKFNPMFTDKNAGCMILGKNMYAMLLTERFFKGFTKKKLVNGKLSTEVMTAIELKSKKAVDEIVKKAVKAGGREPRKPQDHGWMYGRSFEDLDGHIWEPFYADIKKFKKEG